MPEALMAYRFHPVLQRWEAAPPAPAPHTRDTLTCVTYNVWFSAYAALERWGALLEIVRACDADIIAFQEVTPAFLSLVLQQRWVQQEYWVSDATGATVNPYGVLLLTRLAPQTLRLHELPSLMGRALLVAELDLNGVTTSVATVHLESERRSAALRATQLDQMFAILVDDSHAILLGDFNFCASWPEENWRIDQQYQDVWAALRPSEPGYTEDTDLNSMRLEQHGIAKRVRFDRLLLRSPAPGWRAQTIDLLGTLPITTVSPPLFPSDHFGLVSTLVWAADAAVPPSERASPLATAYWVEEQRLLAGSHPASAPQLSLEQGLRRLLDAGITVFVDLTEPRELDSYRDTLEHVAQSTGRPTAYWRLSIQDDGIPAQRQMAVILNVIDGALAAGERVYVHCSAGIGRTGVVVGCYLVRHGLEPQLALAAIVRARAGSIDGTLPSPRTSVQVQFVRDWPVGT